MMAQIGLGVLLHHLFGDGSASIEALEAAQGKVIKSLEMSDVGDGELLVRFEESTLIIRDDGRSCCESRYMTTDDDLNSFVGATFTGVELRDGPEMTTEYGEPHEQQFLLVNTSLGTFTVVTHNEHNGYYGGFYIVAALA